MICSILKHCVLKENCKLPFLVLSPLVQMEPNDGRSDVDSLQIAGGGILL